MAICANCGNEIPEGTKFCTNCGAPLQSLQPPVQTVPSVTNDSPAQDMNDSFGRPVTAGAGAADPFGSSPEAAAADPFGKTAESGSAPYGTAPQSGPSYGAGAVSGGFMEAVPKPSFIEAVKTCFVKYATFSGRARRSEFWYFALFIIICQALLGAIGNAIFGVPENGGTNILQVIFNLAVFIPQMSVSWRRMHDIGKKGTWSLIAAVPIIGWILILVWECTDSHPGENEFGMSPKYPTA